jgi:hypothetical protein
LLHVEKLTAALGAPGLPSSGQLGVYFRTRGQYGSRGATDGGYAGLVVALSSPDGGTYPVPIPSSTTFDEHMSALDPGNSPSWSDLDEAPNRVFVAAIPGTEETASVIEIDCIVPFVVTP